MAQARIMRLVRGLVLLWLGAYGRVALLLALALCLGYPLTRRVLSGPAAPGLALIGGLALLSLAVCLLAWAHVFDGLSVAALGALGTVASLWCLSRDVPRWRQAWRRRWTRPPPALLVCLGALAVVLLAFSVMALYPVSALTFDAANYHLPLAQELVRRHGLVYDPFVRFSFFPQANEALFAVVLILHGGSVGAAALEYALLALLVLVIPLWFVGSGRSPAAGLLAGVLVLASPVVIWAATAAFVDAWTMCFVTAALLVGLDAAEGRGAGAAQLALCGALVGEAAASKYSGAPFGLCAFAAVLIAGRSRVRVGWLAAALAGALAIAAPWYAWTIHTTGDPIYPLAVGLFGNRPGLWTAADIHVQDMVQRAAGPGVLAVLRRDWEYLRGEVQYATGRDSPISRLLVLIALPLLARSARRERVLVATVIASVLSVGFDVLFVGADPRDLLPALGVLAVCGGLGVEWAWRALSGRLVSVAVALLCGLALWPPAAYALGFRSLYGPPPTGTPAVAAFVAAHTPCYQVVRWLNRVHPRGWRAWGDDCEAARFYSRGVLIDDVLGTGSVPRIFDDYGLRLPGDRTLWARLAPLRVRWLILPRALTPDPGGLERHRLFSLVQTLGGERLFAVCAPAATRASPVRRSCRARPTITGAERRLVHPRCSRASAVIRSGRPGSMAFSAPVTRAGISAAAGSAEAPRSGCRGATCPGLPRSDRATARAAARASVRAARPSGGSMRTCSGFWKTAARRGTASELPIGARLS
jgi:hypothetical protein